MVQSWFENRGISRLLSAHCAKKLLLNGLDYINRFFSATKDWAVRACLVLISKHMFNITCGNRSACCGKCYLNLL